MRELTPERLLASLGFGSRKDSRALIRMGIVEINDEIIEDPFSELKDRPAFIKVNGEMISTEEEIFGMLNKPLGYECSAKPQHHESVYSLLPSRFKNMNVKFVGRLDVDSSGLILFSNLGNFIHQMESPKKGLKKKYKVELARPFSKEAETELLSGVLLKGEKKMVQAKSINRISDRETEIEITEGLYHQVRRMFAAIGNHVETLTRISIGDLILNDSLTPGNYRMLTKEELNFLGFEKK